LLAEALNIPTEFESFTCSDEWMNPNEKIRFKTLTHIKELKTPENSKITISDLIHDLHKNKKLKGTVMRIDKVVAKADLSDDRDEFKNIYIYSLPGLYCIECERGNEKIISKSDLFPRHYFTMSPEHQ
jgi:hypothetical protein